MSNIIKICIFSMVLCSFTDSAWGQEKKKERDNQVPAKETTPVKNIEKIVGTWEVESVLDGNKDITNTDTVGSTDVFVFTRENKYMRYSKNAQIDSGAFTVNENHSIIYLESPDETQTTAWEVSFRGGELMVLEPKASAAAQSKRFKYVYRRKQD